MTHKKNSLWGLLGWLTTAIFYGYQNATIAILSLVSKDLMVSLDITSTQYSMIAVLYTTGYAAMQIPVGILLDHYSLKKLTSGSILIVAIGCFILANTQTYSIILATRLLMGIAAAFSVLSSFKVASEWFSSKYFATLAGLTVSLGYLAGLNQPLAYLYSHYTLQQILYGFGIFGVGLTVSAYIFTENYEKISKSLENASDITNDIKEVLSGKTSMSLILYAMLVFTPLWVFKDSLGVLFLQSYYDYNLTDTAAVMDALLLASIIAAPTLGVISDRMGKRRPIIFITPLLLVLCFAAISLRIDIYAGEHAHLVVQAIFGLFGFITWGFLLSYSVFKETHRPHILSTGLGLMNSVNMLGGIIAAPIMTTIIDAMTSSHGIEAAYYYAFFVLPIIVLFSLPLLRLIPETNCRQQYD